MQLHKGASAVSLDDYPDHIITRAWFTAPYWHAKFDRPMQSRDGHDFHVRGASEEEVVAKCAQAIRERAAGPDCPGILEPPGMNRWLIPAWEAKTHLLLYNINPKIAALEATIRDLRAALDGATIAADARAHG